MGGAARGVGLLGPGGNTVLIDDANSVKYLIISLLEPMIACGVLNLCISCILFSCD